MEVKDIPLVGSPDHRNSAQINIAKGQRFIGCVFDVVKNEVTGGGKIYVRKRPGSSVGQFATSNVGYGLSDDQYIGVFYNAPNYYVSDVSSTTPVSCGNLDGEPFPKIPIAYIGGEKIWLITTLTSGWYLATGALSGGSTFTANRTSGSVTLAAVSSFTGLYVGQLLTGTGIASGARIASMNTGASTLDMTIAATSGAATSTTVTRERVAKIIDADFPSAIHGAMVEIDGYVFVANSGTQKIFNSDQNSVTSWGASNFLSLSSTSGNAVGVAKYKGRLVGFGSNGFEVFYNAGNASGSPFTRTGDQGGIGCHSQSSAIAQSIAWGDDDLYFMSPVGCIYRFPNEEVSTNTISRLISQKSGFGTNDIYLFYSRINGLPHVIVSSAGTSTTGFWHDIQKKLWFEGGVDDSAVFGGVDTTTIKGSGSKALNVSGSGGPFAFSETLNTDDGVAYTMTIQTARIDFGTGNRKSILWMELDSDIQSSGTATLEISDDDAQNFTTIGTFDMTQDHPRIYRCGSYKGGINIRITHSANTAFRASTLRVCYTVGSI